MKLEKKSPVPRIHGKIPEYYRYNTYINRIHSAHHHIPVYIDMKIDCPIRHIPRRFGTAVIYMDLEVLQNQ